MDTNYTAARDHLTNRRDFLRKALYLTAGASMMTLGTALYGTKLEPEWLKLERVRITLPNLPPAFDGYRIAQLTDLHVGPGTAPSTISKAVQMALALQPDLVVGTGDYVTGLVDQRALHAYMAPLASAAPDGMWAIMGNHDHWSKVKVVREVLESAGVTELRNAHTIIERDGQALWLAGVDDVWERRHDLRRALTGIPTDATVILLAHEPDFADEVFPLGRVSLQLSGHSHGGQVRLPGVGALVTPTLGTKYQIGLRQLGSMWLYTNRGVGQSHSIRINCRPEVTEITLVRG
jgi:predicted MPP superfamily phosphohydrolase